MHIRAHTLAGYRERAESPFSSFGECVYIEFRASLRSMHEKEEQKLVVKIKYKFASIK